MKKTSQRKTKKPFRFSKRFQKYLRLEVVVDYKSCVYFFCILLFYCAYLIIQHIFAANILYLFEMIAAAYVIAYLQVCLFSNFDEAERIGKKEVFFMFLCTLLYTGCSYVLNWFDRNLTATVFFALFIFASFWCMYLANKIKRAVDTEYLNEMLASFKQTEHCEEGKNE